MYITMMLILHCESMGKGAAGRGGVGVVGERGRKLFTKNMQGVF